MISEADMLHQKLLNCTVSLNDVLYFQTKALFSIHYVKRRWAVPPLQLKGYS